MPDNGIVTLDNGVYKIWFARNYPCYQPNTLLLDNALATMELVYPQPLPPNSLAPIKKLLPYVVMVAL
jgi:acetolactate synthase-1/2/3 large subunit